MTSLFLKKQGAATLLFTVTLLTLSTLIILFATNFAVMQDKITANLNRNSQAFEAAEAGLEFGINYLQVNSATILANPVNGFIPAYSNASTTNVILANNSKFSITYANPIANNYTLITMTSTGTSDDGLATRVVSQRINFGSMLANAPSVPLTSESSVSMTGNANVRNTTSTSTIVAGLDVSIGGSATTILASGISSTSGNIKADVQQNVTSLQTMSQADFFATYFGVPMATAKTNSAHFYTNSTSTNYSSTLNGMTATSIWIDQTGGTATINGNVTIGSATDPVLLVVNGNIDITGNVTFYGFLFVIGEASTDILGNVTLNGAMAGQAPINLTGNVNINYDSAVLTQVKNKSTTSYYAKVPGTWKDF